MINFYYLIYNRMHAFVYIYIYICMLLYIYIYTRSHYLKFNYFNFVPFRLVIDSYMYLGVHELNAQYAQVKNLHISVHVSVISKRLRIT